MTLNAELRDFLRTRRARLAPGDVGIATSGRRRVTGLRREEVAILAGVSLDYYARLEQGRDLQPSDQVLDAIARALRLAAVERLYLVGLEPMPHRASNHLRWLFIDESARELFVDWEMNARASVGVLREAAGRYPHDRSLQALIGELSVASPEFRSWWAEHDVDTRCHGAKRFHHPVVGELILHTEALQLLDGNRWLFAYSPEPGTPSEQALALLGTWAATQDATDAGEPTSRLDASRR